MILRYLAIGIFVLLGVGCQKEEPPPAFETHSLETVNSFPAELPESSGLVAWNNLLWTHNDGGNPPLLFTLDPVSGEVQRNIALRNASNHDWEELAQDKDYFYLGDFGNNRGNRQDLRIYRITKTDLEQDSIDVQKIPFTFSDQEQFVFPDGQHNFDCEAMVTTEEALFLFSKNRADRRTKCYRLEKTIAPQVANLVTEYPINGLVTAAALHPTAPALLLLGYQNDDTSETMLWIFTGFCGDNYFDGDLTTIYLFPDLQFEGLAYAEENIFFISAESEADRKQGLYRFDASAYLPK